MNGIGHLFEIVVRLTFIPMLKMLKKKSYSSNIILKSQKKHMSRTDLRVFFIWLNETLNVRSVRLEYELLMNDANKMCHQPIFATAPFDL